MHSKDGAVQIFLASYRNTIIRKKKIKLLTIYLECKKCHFQL